MSRSSLFLYRKTHTFYLLNECLFQPTVTVLRAEKNQERPPDGDEDEKISKKKKGKRK